MTKAYSVTAAKRGLDALTGRAANTTFPFYIALSSIYINDSHTMATMSEVHAPGTNGYNRILYPKQTSNGYLGTVGYPTIGPFTVTTNISSVVYVTAETGTAGEILGWFYPSINYASWLYQHPTVVNAGEAISFGWAPIYGY